MKHAALSNATLIDEVEHAIRIIQCSCLELACALIPATAEQEQMHVPETDQQAIMSCSAIDANGEYVDLQNVQITSTDEAYLHSVQVSTLSPSDLEIRISQLTRCKRKVFNHTSSHYKSSKSLPPLRINYT